MTQRRQVFRVSPGDEDLQRVAAAVEELDRSRQLPVTDESESLSRSAYVDLLGRVSSLPEGSKDYYAARRENAGSKRENRNGNGGGHGEGRMGPVTRVWPSDGEHNSP